MAAPRVLITDLPEQTVVVDTDLLVVQNGPTSKKLALSRLTTQSSQAVADHIGDLTGADAANTISASPNGASLIGADVQTQLSQAATALAAGDTALAAHLNDSVDAHDATAISTTAGGATNVEEALQSTLNQLTTHTTGIANVHPASAVAVTPAGNLSSVNVQAALVELQTTIDNMTTRIVLLESRL